MSKSEKFMEYSLETKKNDDISFLRHLFTIITDCGINSLAINKYKPSNLRNYFVKFSTFACVL